MYQYERIATTGDVIRVTTTKNEVFTGFLSHYNNIITQNGIPDMEIFLTQHKSHEGKDYGHVCLPISSIKEVELVKKFFSYKQYTGKLDTGKIRNLLAEKDISLEEVEKRTHIEKTILQKIITNDKGTNKLDLVIEIARVLEVSIEEIIH